MSTSNKDYDDDDELFAPKLQQVTNIRNVNTLCSYLR